MRAADSGMKFRNGSHLAVIMQSDGERVKDPLHGSDGSDIQCDLTRELDEVRFEKTMRQLIWIMFIPKWHKVLLNLRMELMWIIFNMMTEQQVHSMNHPRKNCSTNYQN